MNNDSRNTPEYLQSLRSWRQQFESNPSVCLPYTDFDSFRADVLARPVDTFQRCMKYHESHKPKPTALWALHITHGPNMCSKPEWLEGLKKLLRLKKAGVIIGGAIEHVDANIHCHVLVETTYRLSKGSFHTFEKHFGYIKYDRSSGDHGFTDEYMDQEYAFVDLPQLDAAILRIEQSLNEKN